MYDILERPWNGQWPAVGTKVAEVKPSLQSQFSKSIREPRQKPFMHFSCMSKNLELKACLLYTSDAADEHRDV